MSFESDNKTEKNAAMEAEWANIFIINSNLARYGSMNNYPKL
jgi:hypothetical protein